MLKYFFASLHGPYKAFALMFGPQALSLTPWPIVPATICDRCKIISNDIPLRFGMFVHGEVTPYTKVYF